MQRYNPTPETRLRQALLDFLAGSGPALNFLFILPHALSDSEWREVLASAKRLTRYGYVYVADACQQQMEDRHGVRFMPYREGTWPNFGELAAVFVAHDTELASDAEEFYPSAQVSTINPRPCVHHVEMSEARTEMLV